MMLVITNDMVADTKREVHCPRGGFVSFRYLLQSDGMGFGLHRTEIPAADEQRWHYKRHKEACYCISGRGVLTDETTGSRYTIVPGVCYVLNKHDPHTFRAIEPTVLLSVFNPPCVGDEVHDESGSY